MHDRRSAEKLRAQGSVTRAGYVFLKTNRHRPDLPQYCPSAILELPEPTDDSRPILAAASQALHAIYRPHYRFMKAGVMLIDLLDANRAQLSLLDTAEQQAQRDQGHLLMAALDEINQKMGRDTVTLGRPRPGAAWHLRCAHRTPRWSTCWGELPVVHVGFNSTQ